MQHVVRDGAIGERIQLVSHSLEAIDAECPAAIENCHKLCRSVARPTHHRRTPAASCSTRRPACDAHAAPKSQMLVKAHGRQWPTAGRFGRSSEPL